MSVKGQSNVFVRVGDEGNRVAFHFCPRCGATVYWGFEGVEEFVVVAVGAFAEPRFPTPTVSVYEERKHTWVELPAQIERLG